MSRLTPLESLLDVDRGGDLELPAELAALYGRLGWPAHRGPYVIANIVSSLDGVVTLDEPGQEGGGAISGFNPHDRMIMGLLRAAADAVVVGAGTLRADPGHLWTAAYIHPALAGPYEALRRSLEKSGPPLTVIVTGSGDLDPTLRVFQSGEAPVLIVTSAGGARRIRKSGLPESVQIAAVPAAGRLGARAILEAVERVRSCDVLLVEGGPHLLADFFADELVDEQFLTIAPQVAGRDGATERPGLVAGRTFAPGHPIWGTLISVKRAGDHLFLRYAFSRETRQPEPTIR